MLVPHTTTARRAPRQRRHAVILAPGDALTYTTVPTPPTTSPPDDRYVGELRLEAERARAAGDRERHASLFGRWHRLVGELRAASTRKRKATR